MNPIYDLTDYTTELDSEARELAESESDYQDWLDSLSEEQFLIEIEKSDSKVWEL